MSKRTRLRHRVTIKKLYEFFLDSLKLNSKYQVDKNTFKEICIRFNELVADKIMDGYTYSLPYGLGDIRIRKNKQPKNKRAINYKASKICGKRVYHNNDHSDNYAAKWFWDKYNCPRHFTNRHLYAFDATRFNKREFARRVKEENVMIKIFE